jgi:membrane-bound ClpP family serine protease
MKMLDKDMGILKGKTAKGTIRYLAFYPGDKLKNKDKVIAKARAAGGFKEVAVVMEPGTTRYKAKDARACGLCYEEFMNSRDRVVRANGLSEASLREDVLQGQVLHPWLIEFSGPVSEARINSVRRKMEKAISKGGNFLILQLDCESGTDTQAARDFAEYLRKLTDDKGTHPVKTVAYIPSKRSLGAATAIALGCNEIIMAGDAVLGDFDYLKDEKPETYEMKRKALVGLAEEQWYSPLLVRGMMDKDLVLLKVQSRADPGYFVLVSDKEYKEDQQSKRPKWTENNAVIKHQGEFLALNAKRAVEFGVARKVEDDLEGVYRQYGIKREEVRHSSADLLDDIEQFFQKPLVRMLLVMLGIIGLILEMKMPGVGIPGVIAAVCFVLYFWANSSVGHFMWLAILLFALGLVLICLEVFFLPGMAVFGISGVVLVVASLVLVTLEKAPSTTRDWFELGTNLSLFTFVLIGGIAAAFFVARYLPQIPYANRLVLTPPTERPESPEAERASTSEAERNADLLGAIGEAATTLRPAGKARFGDQFLDVIAEGSYVNAGKRVQVIEIEGNRIVVKEV